MLWNRLFCCRPAGGKFQLSVVQLNWNSVKQFKMYVLFKKAYECISVQFFSLHVIADTQIRHFECWNIYSRYII